MTEDDQFHSWYNEGTPIPVAHPLPWCSATVAFPKVDTIEWKVYNYRDEEVTVETFTHSNEWKEDIPDSD